MTLMRHFWRWDWQKHRNPLHIRHQSRSKTRNRTYFLKRLQQRRDCFRPNWPAMVTRPLSLMLTMWLRQMDWVSLELGSVTSGRMPLQAARTSPLRTETTENTHTHTHSAEEMSRIWVDWVQHSWRSQVWCLPRFWSSWWTTHTHNDNVTITSTNREDVCRENTPFSYIRI